MSLKDYNQKRNFSLTPEPKGIKPKQKTKQLLFVIQHHKATADHFDLRLQHNGQLVSFAVPKGLPKTKGVKRLAVMVEPHPISYANFEGVIPKGNYGAGVVEIYDKGTYTQLENFDSGIKKGNLNFFLNGEKHKGGYRLIKTVQKNWLIIKSNDKFVEKVEKTQKKPQNPFKSISPMLATPSNEVPAGKDWAFEIKYDGYRIIAFKNQKTAKLFSRNGTDYSEKLQSVCKSISTLAKDIPFVVDGEVVCFNSQGVSDFGLLQQNIKNQTNNFFYVVFDLLALNGKDLRSTTFLKRKEMLQNLLVGANKNIMFSSHVIGNGKKCFKLAKENNLEGIVAKKIDSIYEEKRSPNWQKIKCYMRQEFVIVGYQTTSKNQTLSAILVAYSKNKNLVFAGKVGTGFSEQTKQELSKLFKPLITNNCPIKNPPNINANWLKPKLVAEIKFAEFTKAGILRQPSFVGIRQDKNPKDVVREGL